jgi:hypothetical protein
MTYKSTGTKTVAINWTTGAKSKISAGNDAVAAKNLSRRKKAWNVLVLIRNCVKSVRTAELLYIPGWSMPY